MTKQLYDVHVQRINESAHQDPEFDTQAVSVTVSEDGDLKIDEGNGQARALGASTWGSVTITRVPRT